MQHARLDDIDKPL